MSKKHDVPEYDEEDEYMELIPARFVKILTPPNPEDPSWDWY